MNRGHLDLSPDTWISPAPRERCRPPFFGIVSTLDSRLNLYVGHVNFDVSLSEIDTSSSGSSGVVPTELAVENRTWAT